MSERVVAISADSRYADTRGEKVMPDGLSRAKVEGVSKANGEAGPGVKSGEVVKKPEAVGVGERKARLEQQRKEVEEAAERTKAEAQETAEKLKKPQERKPHKKTEPVEPTAENPQIVSTFPHIANIDDPEGAAFMLERAGVKVDIPKDWGRWGSVRRERWLESHGVENVTKLPDFDANSLEAGFLHKVDVDGRDVGVYKRRGKDEYVVGNLPPKEWTCTTFTRIFENAGIKIEIPASIDGLPYAERLEALSKLGVEVIPEAYNMMPADSLFEENDKADPGEAYKRLHQLRSAAEKLSTQAVPWPPSPPDVEELHSRLMSLDVQKRVADINSLGEQETFIRLRELQYIEESLAGTNDFDTAGFNKEREFLFDRLRFVKNHDGRINDVLGELLRMEAAGGAALTGSAQVERQVWLGYLDQIKRHMNESRTNFQNFRFVYNAAKEVEDFEKLQAAAGTLFLVDNFLNSRERKFFGQVRDRINRHFTAIKAGHSKAELELIYGPVISDVLALRKSLGSYIPGIKDVEQRLFDERDAVVGVSSHNEPLGEKGLVEWHTVKVLGELQKQLEGENALNVPAEWEDSLKHVQNNLRFAESGDFSQEDLSAVRQRVVQIAESLNQRIDTLTGAEKERAIKDLTEINELKDAVLAVYDLRLAMQSSDMNPEEVVKHFGSHVWKDTTFQVYFRRFSKDVNGETFVDNNGEFNIQDRAMQTVFRQLTKERGIMNQIEALTIVDISTPLAAGDPRLDEMLRLMGRVGGGGIPAKPFTAAEIQRFEFLRGQLEQKFIAKGFGINQWAGDNADTDKMKDVINDWYKENLLLGAFGTHEAAFAGDPNEGRQRLDMRREDLLRDFEVRLLADGVGADKVEEYKNSGLLNQVMNNAYHLSWSFGAFSDYDGIRVWDTALDEKGRKKIWFRSRDRGDVYQLGKYVFNNGTTWFNGRMVDHYTEFLQDEVRGRPRDVNFVFTSHMLGKKRGILGHNRLMVKVVNDNLRNAEPGFKDQMVATPGMTFDTLLSQKMNTIENHEKLNINEPYDAGWLRGASIEELLEDGELTLENVKWSRVFASDKENVRKFNMGDWWGDRAETHKFFASGAMQEYLKNPNTGFFFKMNKEVFYSKREIRIQPWMKLVIPAHQEIGSHWQEWWKLPYDMPHAETKRVIDDAVRLNMLDYRYRDEMEDKLLGWGPFSGNAVFGRVKALRYMMEMVDRNVREAIKHGWEYALLWPVEFVRVAFQQGMSQAAGK
jgi:hypothetical protein